jgi:epidermal growth factor receptor kinase substrate 8
MIPRDKWKGHHGANYHPVFFDGWSPDYPVIDELEAKSRRLDYNDFEEFEQPAVTKTGLQTVASTGSPVFKDFSARSEISIDSIERNGGATVVDRAPSGSGIDPQTEAWLEELHARDAKIVQVTYPRTANNDKELTVVRGEFLEVLDDTRKWWKARNIRGRTAHVPHTIVTTYSYPDGRDDMYGGPQPSGYKRVSCGSGILRLGWVNGLNGLGFKEIEVKLSLLAQINKDSGRLRLGLVKRFK